MSDAPVKQTIYLQDCIDGIEDHILDGTVNCVVTDPPFGVDHTSNFARTDRGKEIVKPIAGDDSVDSALELFSNMWHSLYPKFADEAEMYIFTSWSVYPDWSDHLAWLFAEDFFKEPHQYKMWNIKMVLVWEKGWPGLGDLEGNWGCGHEFIIYCKKGRRKMPSRRSGVLHYDKPAPQEQIHPTEKPVALIEELLKMSTDPGSLVVDPFSGSGSTAKACQNLGRECVAFEIDVDYHARSTARLTQLNLF